MVHAGALEGCLAMSTLGKRALLVPALQAGSIVAAGLTRWRASSATALKGTIWLMVSLVMAVEAREWRRKG